MPTKFVGLLESVIVAADEEITGAVEPLPVSSTKHLIWRSGRVAAVYVWRLTEDFLGSLRRTEQGRQENVDCGGKAYEVTSLGVCT